MLLYTIFNMFRNTKAFFSFSVDDIRKAQVFYSSILGLSVSEVPEGLEIHIFGGGEVFCYQKPDHVPATYTILNFPVPNIEHTVDELNTKGVKFEHYEGLMKTDKKGIARSEGMAIAWFKDPAGNFISIMEH